MAIHNTEINQQPVKCAWGKESGDPNNMQAMIGLSHGFPFGSVSTAAFGQQIAGYWYPNPTYPTATTTTATLQTAQFLPSVPGITYGQFGGYQQGYMG